jgi:phospholipid/cholesterol/gamma-HCH transport system permease protein
VLNTGLFKPPCVNPMAEPSDFLPQVIGSTVSVLTLAAVSSTLTLILAYLVVYGFSPWGFDEYTRMVGRVFDPVIVVIFIIKSTFFSLAVAIIPLASSLHLPNNDDPMPRGTVRLFLVLAMIEAGTLAIKYI